MRDEKGRWGKEAALNRLGLVLRWCTLSDSSLPLLPSSLLPFPFLLSSLANPSPHLYLFRHWVFKQGLKMAFTVLVLTSETKSSCEDWKHNWFWQGWVCGPRPRSLSASVMLSRALRLISILLSFRFFFYIVFLWLDTHPKCFLIFFLFYQNVTSHSKLLSEEVYDVPVLFHRNAWLDNWVLFSK